MPDPGWSNWDLEDRPRPVQPRAGHWSAPKTTAATKRLLRVRCAMRLSRFAPFVLRAYAVLDGIRADPRLAVGGGGDRRRRAGQFAAMAIRLDGFGRLMHRIIETVAKPAG